MDELLNALQEAFAAYRQELEAAQKKRKPTDGLLGFGNSIKDDPCHERFDERVAQAVSAIAAAQPSPTDARRVVRLLLIRDDLQAWHLSAQWMLRAAERHALPLIPFLSREAAAELSEEYTGRYKRWERLPVQKQVIKALKASAKA